ncbi:MAG: hypothetical protein ACRCYV_03710 [Aeromonas sp.]
MSRILSIGLPAALLLGLYAALLHRVDSLTADVAQATAQAAQWQRASAAQLEQIAANRVAIAAASQLLTEQGARLHDINQTGQRAARALRGALVNTPCTQQPLPAAAVQLLQSVAEPSSAAAVGADPALP